MDHHQADRPEERHKGSEVIGCYHLVTSLAAALMPNPTGLTHNPGTQPREIPGQAPLHARCSALFAYRTPEAVAIYPVRRFSASNRFCESVFFSFFLVNLVFWSLFTSLFFFVSSYIRPRISRPFFPSHTKPEPGKPAMLHTKGHSAGASSCSRSSLRTCSRLDYNKQKVLGAMANRT